MYFSKEFNIETQRDCLIDITDSVKEVIESSGMHYGIVVVETKEATAGILKINNAGKEVLDDVVREMRRIVPARINYYNQVSPENAAGSIKSALFGSSVSLILQSGKLYCEENQRIYFADYDGPYTREYTVAVIG